MKKFLTLALILLFMASVLAIGCGGQKEAEETTTVPQKVEETAGQMEQAVDTAQQMMEEAVDTAQQKLEEVQEEVKEAAPGH